MNDGPKPIHVALIGCGPLACRFHLPAIRDMGTAELIALVDPDVARLAAAARLAPGAARYHDLDTVFERSPVDAVVIAAEPALRAGLCVEALNRGLPVYVEPPLADSVAEGRRVESAWLASAAGGMTGLRFRFARVFEQVRRRVAAGVVGRVENIRCERPVIDCLDYDLLPWLADSEIEAVHHRDSAILLRLASGVECSLRAAGRHVVEVTGIQGRIEADPAAGTVRVFPQKGWTAAVRDLDPRRWVHGGEPEASYRRAIEAFVRSVRRGEDTQPDIADGMLALIVADAARRSATGRRMVPLEEYAEQEHE